MVTSTRSYRRLALRGALITPCEDGSTRFLSDAVLLADGDGRIDFVGTPKAARERYAGPLRDVRPQLIMPGMVDAHLHFPQTRIIGQATGPLLHWLERSVFPEEARFRRRDYATAVAGEFIGRMLRAGTTSAAIFSSSSPVATEVLFERLDASGMRALVGLTLMDRRCPAELRVERKEAMAASRKLIQRWHQHDDGRLQFVVTPRFALSCSRAMLQDAGRLAAEHELPIQTHIAETPAEGTATLKVHRYANSYLDVYDRAGLLSERTILAHAIHMSAAEWQRSADAGVSVAHCPDSNFFLGSGRMDWREPHGRAIAIGLGSDVAAGRSFSMRRAMASAYDNALCLASAGDPGDPQLQQRRLLELATLGGARCLGIADRVGSLEVGKEADVVVVPLSGRASTQQDVLAELLFDCDDVQVSACYVRGRPLNLAIGSR